MKFKQAFDVIVLDEADAFPYANSQLLVTSVYQALKKDGIIFFLTATLNTTLKKMIRRQEVLLSTLPLRFHGQPLPNLSVQRVNKWRKRLPIRVVRQMIHLKNKGIKFLVFVPQVKDIENVINQIKNEDRKSVV